MLLEPVNLRLETADGSGCEEYRIQDGDIEVRRVRSSTERGRFGRSPNNDEWQRLTPRELSGHVHDNTVVAQWLRHRIGWRRLILKCTDQETLSEFGVRQDVQDRFAA
jgi:hypothetical protein